MPRTVVLLIGLVACSGRTPRTSDRHSSTAPDDSAFALVQTRGHTAMGVDQYTSSHRFEPLPDGGRITLQRDQNDSAGTAQIRAHMQKIAAAFAAGDFTLPGFVHDREVPGTATMAARRDRITYSTDTLPRGGSVRIQSDDSTAVAAVHQFLSFQRIDHRSPHGEGSH
jgi:uncharacterized protein YjhX (UPF0386 family)